MATFAFSTTGSFWKTRYSFEPDCYASSDNFFVSFNPVQITGNFPNVYVCWVHNKNPIRNAFYGQIYPSSLSVVSNENPSAEKAYKALSIETNENFFSAKVLTNIDSRSSISKPQETIIPSFSEREECLYASIGSSIKNSTTQVKTIAWSKNLQPGNINKSILDLVSLGWIGPDDNILEYVNYKFSIIEVIPLDTSAANLYGNNTKLAFIDGVSNIYVYKSGNEFFISEFSADECYERSFFSLIGFLTNPTSTTPGTYLLIAHEGDVELSLFQTFLGFNRAVIAVTNPSINGDVIRGKYARIDIESRPNGEPFELYAVNAEYAMSPLDSSR